MSGLLLVLHFMHQDILHQVLGLIHLFWNNWSQVNKKTLIVFKTSSAMTIYGTSAAFMRVPYINWETSAFPQYDSRSQRFKRHFRTVL
jgi:hypothetical protein